MRNNMVVLFVVFLTVLTWAVTIYLILIRRFQNQSAILKYNFWTALLMGVNLLLYLPTLFYLGGQSTSWLVRQGWLLVTAGDVLVTAGLLAFILLMIVYRHHKVSGAFDYVVVLGAGLNHGQVPPVLAARLDHAQQLWRINQRGRLVVTGGLVHHDTISEAEAMGEYLMARGVSSRQVLYEDRALNTWQNLQNCWSLISDDWDGTVAPRVAVVTSSFHLLRARSYARRLGIRWEFMAAPTPWQYQPLTVVRDYLGNIRDHRYLAMAVLVGQFLIAEIFFR